MNDDLSDLFGSATGTSGQVLAFAPKAPPASYVLPEKRFEERCKKCGGSGNFVGYSGRVVGPCFSCKGAGKLVFKSSAEDRAESRAKAADKKERNRAENIDDFSKRYPDVYAWMNGNAFAFAVSLLDAVGKYGDLTDNQMAAAVRCIDKQKKWDADKAAQVTTKVATEVAQKETAPIVDLAPIVQALDRAKAKMLRPKLRVAEFSFAYAPDYSRNAGMIYVADRTREEVYYGRITRDGRFLARPTATAEIVAKLKEIAKDPKAAAVAHGFETSTCSCCGRMLTDPVSVANGIGPICAANFGW